MNVLFLDIDGVLNSGEWQAAGHMRTRDPASHLSPELCARLERVLVETGARIVISSAWRVTWSPGAIEALLCERGAASARGRVIGATPTWRESLTGSVGGAYRCRGEEIAAWLSEHPEVVRFAIVDDAEDMGDLRMSLVRTSWKRGLEDRHVEQLVALLTEAA